MAITAYNLALEERKRDRVPLQWAETQNNLGNALRALGDRETGTGSLAMAVAAYRAALEELTHDRTPLQRATTQNNLGGALAAIGERETGTARLDEAVATWDACLIVLKYAWPREWVEQLQLRRDQTQVEIARRNTE